MALSYMLNQASGDRQILAKQLNISPFQLSGDKKTMRRSRNRKEAEKTNNKCFQRGGSKKGPPFYFRTNRHQVECTRYL